MTAPRPNPFDLVFEDIAHTRFPEIQSSLAEAAVDASNRDAFLLDRNVVQVLRDIVPDEGVGEAVDQHVALLHNAYLFWQGGRRIVRLTREETEAMLTSPRKNGLEPGDTIYVQFPERTIWAQVNEGAPHEPLDGLFVTTRPGGEFQVLGVFGLHPDRIGFSVAEVGGLPPNGGMRENGSPRFAPLLPGGAAAKLYSVDGAGELIELGARAAESARSGS